MKHFADNSFSIKNRNIQEISLIDYRSRNEKGLHSLSYRENGMV